MSERILLDTCAFIWLSQEEPIAAGAEEAIRRVVDGGGALAVSAMSAWELGMLTSMGRVNTTKTADRWFFEFVEAANVEIEAAHPAILIAASFLPGRIHKDPMDRILVATARERDLQIMTRDRAILAYAEQGHVQAIPC